MGRFLYVWIKRVECCSYYPQIFCKVATYLAFTVRFLTGWLVAASRTWRGGQVREGCIHWRNCDWSMNDSKHETKKGQFWDVPMSSKFICRKLMHCTLYTACQDPNAMLKAAGLYIEKAKPVALPFTSTNEIVPPPGFFDKGYCKSDVDRLYIYCHSRRLRSRRTLACNVVFW